jgi:2-oxoglutarate dehydrogenase E2 component (dihydrolipoamide succinyltransferase)
MPVELVVPKVGESITQVEVGDWLKKDGDVVSRDEILVVLESEKTTVELPSPVAGVIRISKSTGETVDIGTVLAVIEEGATANGTSGNSTAASSNAASNGGSSATPEPEWQHPAHADDQDRTVAPEQANPSFGVAGAGVPPAGTSATPESALGADGGAKRQAPSQTTVASQTPNEATQQARNESEAPRVMPAAERVLAENNLQATQVEASGPGGRLLKEDVQRHIEHDAQQTAQSSTQLAPAAAPQSAADSKPVVASAPTVAGADEEVVPMSFLRRKVAERLVEAQQTAALLTTFNEIDMTNVMEMRKSHQDAFQKKHGVKLGFMSFFVKAAVDALKQILVSMLKFAARTSFTKITTTLVWPSVAAKA